MATSEHKTTISDSTFSFGSAAARPEHTATSELYDKALLSLNDIEKGAHNVFRFLKESAKEPQGDKPLFQQQALDESQEAYFKEVVEAFRDAKENIQSQQNDYFVRRDQNPGNSIT
ncbi:MAG: hypothetical protein ACE365_04190 [Gammaproteobacteria bacterium]